MFVKILRILSHFFYSLLCCIAPTVPANNPLTVEEECIAEGDIIKSEHPPIDRVISVLGHDIFMFFLLNTRSHAGIDHPAHQLPVPGKHGDLIEGEAWFATIFLHKRSQP